MTSYAAMLRGINVGGHAKVSMADLRTTFAEMGFGAARTYIQSGNVLFATSTAAAKLRAMLEEGLEARFGLGIKVVLRTGPQLAEVVARNPLATGGRDPSKLHVTFLASKPATSAPSGLDPRAFLPDEFRVSGREVYVHCPEGYGRTKLNNAFFERSLDVVATTRTLRTVTTLADMAR
ncbi:MAG TPA: DUF1697 domain-containing protein [Acidimicrobiales bacterium]